jgi:hypothetical protein
MSDNSDCGDPLSMFSEDADPERLGSVAELERRIAADLTTAAEEARSGDDADD